MDAFQPDFTDLHPAFEALAEAAAPFRAFDRWPTVAELDALAGPRAGVRFAPCPPRPRRLPRQRRAREGYDGRIVLDGEVPTRACSWHDFLNALVWASFPRAKRALHARQLAALRARVGETFGKLPGARTPEQDALALLDEGGLLVAAPASAFGGPRATVGALDHAAARCFVFGHAIYEHFVRGESARACPVALPFELDELTTARAPAALRALVDARLAELLEDPGSFARRPGSAAVTPAPVLFAERDASAPRAAGGEADPSGAPAARAAAPLLG